MDVKKIEQFVLENGLPKFRLEQIRKAVFQDSVRLFAQISTIPKDLREKLEQEIKILSFDVQDVLIADNGQSAKALLRLHSHPERSEGSKDSSATPQNDKDYDLIETVLISPKPGVWSVCVSCQVGCQMGCRFCATGKMGFVRNLTAEEITDQILFWKQFLRDPSLWVGNWKLEIENYNISVGNIVYMGMGEPFNNWENVSESIRMLTDEKLFGFSSRSLSVSTSGIVEGIEKLAEKFPQVNLAISLHFASDEKRSQFMPVNQKHNLEALKQAIQNYFTITRRKIFLEYIMLDSINDTALDAKCLADYIKSIGNRQLLHVNLIRYNITSENLKPSSKNRTYAFKKELEKYGVAATIRKSLGDEIKGACGQLAGNEH